MTHSPHHLRGAPVRAAAALILLVATLAMFGADPLSATPTAGARPAAARCSGSTGVSVEIDFRSLGGGYQTRCAPGSPGDGFKALSGAGIAYRTVRGGGFLCTISGVPASNCGVIPPTSDYWTYWHKAPGGSWQYANLGAGSRTPPLGSTEGWSYYSSACDGPSPLPPGSSSRPNCKPAPTPPAPPPTPAPTAAPTPPAPRPTAPPAPRPTAPPAPRPTAPPAPRPPAPRPPANGGGSAGGSGSPGTPGSGSSSDPAGEPDTPADAGDNGDQPGSTKPGDVPKAGEVPSTTTAPEAEGGEAEDGEDEAGATDDSTTTQPGGETSTTAADDRSLDEEAIAAREGTRDLGDDGTGGSSPLPVIFGVLLVGALAAAGVVLARRNRAVPG